MSEKQANNGRWVITSWLLTTVFFGASYVYALHDSTFAFVVWFLVFMVWLYIAVNATTQYFKAKRSARSDL